MINLRNPSWGDIMLIVKKLLIPVTIVTIIIASYIFYLSITDYNPDEIVILPISNNQVKTLPSNEEITIATFNIGYGGLDEAQDNYSQNGIGVKASNKEKVQENLDGVTKVLDLFEPDILLFQEIDIKSSRSYRVDQLEYLSEKYPNYSYIYGKNYDVAWNPFPFLKPLGKIESGLATFSRFYSTWAYRYSLPGQEDGFHKYYDYDRSFIVSRFDVENGETLLVINLHLSDFSQTGVRRHEEFQYLKNYLIEEARKGSYIVVGGDWNHNLPGMDPYKFKTDESWPSWQKNIPEEFKIAGLKWIENTIAPTVRSLSKPYERDSNFLATTDGFLISENIAVSRIFTYSKHDFKYSYHNPVIIKLSLR